MEHELYSPHKTDSVRGVLGEEFESFVVDAVKLKYVSGIGIGVLRDQESSTATAGAGVVENSLYEMGSVTKTFTAELLHKMIERGELRWDDRLDHFVPGRPNPSALPEARTPITLGDLVTHRSGLALPKNFRGDDRQNPNGSFSRSDLIHYLEQRDLTKSPDEPYVYGSIGYAALGLVLEQASGKNFTDMLQEEILTPLKLADTCVARYGQDGPSIVQGHAQLGRAVPPWKQDAFGPAGGLCSTVPDMLRWCQCSILQMKARSAEADLYSGDVGTAMGWETSKMDGWYERPGETGGFSSFLGVDVRSNRAVVLLANRKSSKVLQEIGENAIRALDGERLQPLSGNYGQYAEFLMDLHIRSKFSATLVGKLKANPGGVRAVEMFRAMLKKVF